MEKPARIHHSRSHRRRPARCTSLALVLASTAIAGCTSTTDDPPEGPACTSGACGDARTRLAIPTPGLARIGFPASKDRSHASLKLEAISPAYADTADYVAHINETTDELLDEIAEVADGAPEREDDGLAIWRKPDAELDGFDAVVVVATDDEESYDVQFLLGPTGFDPADGAVYLEGAVQLGADDAIDAYELVLDFDEIAEQDDDATGTLTIAGHPFDGGDREVWFDFEDFAAGPDDEPYTSRTTYWIFGEDDGGLEYEDDEYVAYARWGSDGGRYDHHAVYVDEVWGDVEEIATDCWDPDLAQTFDAVAWFTDEDAYGELDGEETDCVFGPAQDHPDPSSSFADLPGDGEWAEIEDSWIDCDEEPEACE
jgi:hypothetical protein